MEIANLKYSDQTHTLIDMDVTLDADTANQFHAAGETIPFTYHPEDVSPVSGAVRALLAEGSHTIAAYVAPPAEVPKRITPRQARLALNQAGLRAAVEAYIAGASQDIKDTWEFSTVIERENPIITGAASALGLTDTQLDSLFTLGATL